jgi:integrase
MAQPATGSIDTHPLADGTRAFHLRYRVAGQRERLVLHERTACACACGGGWDERAARTELGNIQARVRAGVWRRALPPAVRPSSHASPTFHEYSSRWLQAKIDGVIGDKPIRPSTQSDYRWKLSSHLLPFFAPYRLDEIDRELCLAFKSHKLAEASPLREEIAAGADIRDDRGRRAVPLGASSIRKILDTLATILDDAIEDGLLDRNPARGRRMRVRVPRPVRTFLETDELIALIDAAQEQDVAFASPRPPSTEGGGSREAVARLHAAGLKGVEIAAELAIATSTVSYHLNRQRLQPVGEYIGRRVVVEILGRSGVRASELCDIRLRDLRLHDPDGARFRIRESKTQAGVREVQMSPDLVEAVIDHVDRLRRAGRRVGPDAHLVQNVRGGRMDRQRVGTNVREAAQPPAAAAHHAAHLAAHLHLDRAARQQLRRQMGHESGRTRRLEDDARRLRPARTTRRTQPRHLARQAPPSGARATRNDSTRFDGCVRRNTGNL